MKKILFAGIAALALAACSKTSVVDSDLAKDGNKIAFASYSNTRSTPIGDNNSFQNSGYDFGVTAFISAGKDTPYMGAADAGTHITYASGWNYANPTDAAYWPTGKETLDFFAYAPYTDENRVAVPAFGKTTGIVFNGYTVTTTAADQRDFMYAVELSKTKATAGGANGSVVMQFRHALTQLHFAARTKTDNLYVDIEANGIQIHNIKSVGDFARPTSNDAIWTNQKTLTTYTIPSAAIKINRGTDFQAVSKTDNAMMLLPQKFTAWDVSTEVKVAATAQENGYLTISCKIYTADDANGTNKVYLNGSDAAFNKIYVPISSKDANGTTEIWAMNNKITYNLVFGGGYTEGGEDLLDPITFTTDVVNWEDVPGGEVNF